MELGKSDRKLQLNLSQCHSSSNSSRSSLEFIDNNISELICNIKNDTSKLFKTKSDYTTDNDNDNTSRMIWIKQNM